MGGTLMLRHQTQFIATHTQPRLPSWHPCFMPGHGHDWTVTLTLAKDGRFTDEESAAARVTFEEFDAWAGEHLAHQHLNTVDGFLAERCGTDRIAEWIWDRWAPRMVLLDTVTVSGPVDQRPSGTDATGRTAYAYVRPEYTYRPAQGGRTAA